MSYPTDIAGRRAHRAEIRRRVFADAERRIAHLGRSLVCADDVRHDSCHGAAVCICECHDPKGDA